MKFKLIKKGCIDISSYGEEDISTGDVIELTGRFAEKASNNPDFEEVVKKAAKTKDK